MIRNSWLAPQISEGHDDVIDEITKLAMEHSKKAKEALSKLPKSIRLIFLPIVFADKILEKTMKNPGHCLTKPIVLSPLYRQWLAFRGASKL